MRTAATSPRRAVPRRRPEFGFATARCRGGLQHDAPSAHLKHMPGGCGDQIRCCRARFTGQPEHVINFVFFVAEEPAARRSMASEMGFAMVNEMIGHKTQSTAST